MDKLYITMTSARIAFVNSGVYRFTKTNQQAKAVVSDMYRNNKTPEQAVADVVDLDATDRRKVGAQPNMSITTDLYEITIHSDSFVEIVGTAGTTTLEYDDAADFAESVRNSPEHAEGFANIARLAFGVDE